MNRENSCKLDGLQTVAKPKQKFYLNGITHSLVLSHKIHTFKPNDKRTFVQQLRPSNPAMDRDKVTTRHCGLAAGSFLQDLGADTGYEGNLREIRYC